VSPSLTLLMFACFNACLNTSKIAGASMFVASTHAETAVFCFVSHKHEKKMYKYVCMYVIYFFSSFGGGGAATLNSSGRLGLVPSPTCSHGERDSKLL
jgi:hypothetical protein